MAIKQLSVYLENKPGKLAEAIGIVSGAGVNLRALSLADTLNFGIMRLITSDLEAAEKALSEKTAVRITDVIAVRMDDKSGGLYEILKVLEAAKVNIEYMYAFTAAAGSACAVLRVDDVARAESALAEAGIRSLGEEDLFELLDEKQ